MYCVAKSPSQEEDLGGGEHKEGGVFGTTAILKATKVSFSGDLCDYTKKCLLLHIAFDILYSKV